MKIRTPAVDTTSAPTVEILGEAHGAQPSSGQDPHDAKWMLAHLKPLDEWLATTDKERLNACSDILGEPVEFYNKFKAQLERLAAEGGE